MAEEKVQLSISAVLDGGSINDLTKALSSGVASATTEGGKRAQKQYANHIAAAMEAGVRAASDSRTVKRFGAQVANAKAMQDAIVQAYEKGDKEHGKFLERERKKEMKHLKQIADRRKSHYQDYVRLQERSMSQIADDYNDKIQQGVGNLLSGNLSPGGILKSIGGKMQQRGDAATQAGRGADASKTTRAMGQIGKVMAGMGTAVMAIGSIAVLVVGLVKAFIDLDAKIKNMNKSIAESAGAADFGFGTANDAAYRMSGLMDNIRTQILDQTADWDGYRQSSESMFKVLGTMNEMNFTFKAMQKEIDNTTNSINSFADISIRAVAYGKLLGVETGQMGSDMAKMANEWGVGLDTISEGLHLVHKEALLSGFSTKRFYSTILEVTSGLGQYNVRLQEAAGLLTTMGAAMGESQGEGMFKSMATDTSFAGKSPVDALRDILIKGGPGAVQDIFKDEAVAKAADMFNAMTEEQRQQFGQKFKLDTSSAQAFGEAFAKAAPGQKAVGAAMGEFGIAGEARGFGTAAARSGQAGQGNLDRMATSFGDLGAASRMRFMMRLPAMLGHSFSDLSDLLERGAIPELQAFLDTQGMSMEQFKNLAELQGALADEFEAMKKATSGMGVGSIIDRGSYGKFRKEEGGKFVAVDDQGNPLSSAFKDVDSYLAAQNDFITQQTTVIDEDLELGKQIAKNTEDFNTVIEENVAKILNKIYITLMDIWHWISGDASKRKEMKSYRQTFERNQAKQQAAVGSELEAARSALSGTTPGTPEGVAAQERVTNAEKRQAMLNQVASAAPSVNPEQFQSAAEYTNAVYAAAGVDKSEFAATGAPGVAPSTVSRGGGRDTASYARIGNLLSEAVTDRPLVSEPGYDDFAPIRKVIEDEVLSGLSGDSYNKFNDLLAYVEENWVTNAKASKRSGPLGGYEIRPANRRAISELNSALTDPSYDWTKVKGAQAAFNSGFLGGLPSMQDMYVPSNGRPVRLDSADSVLAMKPGGAVDRALGGGRGGGGVTIIVKNYGNPREVQNAVMRGIKIARGEPFVQ